MDHLLRFDFTNQWNFYGRGTFDEMSRRVLENGQGNTVRLRICQFLYPESIDAVNFGICDACQWDSLVDELQCHVLEKLSASRSGWATCTDFFRVFSGRSETMLIRPIPCWGLLVPGSRWAKLMLRVQPQIWMASILAYPWGEWRIPNQTTWTVVRLTSTPPICSGTSYGYFWHERIRQSHSSRLRHSSG